MKKFFLNVNCVVLYLTDKIYDFYKKHIDGIFLKCWKFCKNFVRNLLFFIKNIIERIVGFYKKDKKRAIIYFIILYIIYKFLSFFVAKISVLFVNNKNDMVVAVREVVPEKISRKVNCYGYLESENNLQYLSEVRGNIEKIFVQEKQYVHEGQLIMSLDSKFTENSYISAKSVLESKKLKFDAMKKLFKDGLESEGNLKSTEAEFESARSNFESAKKAYNGLMVKAPFDGYIDNINLKEGSQINNGTKLFTLERIGAMQVKCEVNNLSKDETKVGDIVGVFVGGHKMAQGTIAVIGDSVDVYSGSRTILVKNIVSLPGFEDRIKNGMSVMMKINAVAQDYTYKISSEALETTETGGFMVKILKPKNNEVSFKRVWIYDENDGIDYVTGLDEGEYVIERGHEFVSIGETGIKYSIIDKSDKKNVKKENFFIAKIHDLKLFFVKLFVHRYEFYNFIKEDIIKIYNKINALLK